MFCCYYDVAVVVVAVVLICVNVTVCDFTTISPFKKYLFLNLPRHKGPYLLVT